MDNNKKHLIIAVCAGYATCGFIAMYVIRKQEQDLAAAREINNMQKAVINILLKGVNREVLAEAKTFLTDVKFNQIVRELEIDG